MESTTATKLYEELEREEAGHVGLPFEKRHGHCVAVVFTTPIAGSTRSLSSGAWLTVRVG
jgi:hypothetical protein